ncbi:MAG: magnesium/cobalt transporter CorA [Candidatus Hodarchaeota archaeon]
MNSDLHIYHIFIIYNGDLKIPSIYRRIARIKKKEKVGYPPGTLVYTGDKKKIDTKIKVIDYDEESFNFKEFDNLEEDFSQIEKNKVRWIKITGLAQVDIIEGIGNQFEIHPLVLEDILNPNQRPKFEVYGDYIFTILERIFWNTEGEMFEREQVSLILGPNYVISLEERETDTFNPIIERVRVPRGRVRYMGADYLFYTLIDIIIDNYFIILEITSEKIEHIEDELISNPLPETLQAIYKLKRSMIDLRKTVWPLRELVNMLQREPSKLINEGLQIYLRDLYDHIYKINDLLEGYRDIIFGMLDMYLSSVSNRMNEIMKVLTIISTIFMPLSFLAGFYGMNFLFMPELSNPFAYPLLIVLMIFIGILMLYFFKKKKWL